MKMYTGFEEFNTRYDTEEEIVREVFGGVQFESGYLQKYMTELYYQII